MMFADDLILFGEPSAKQATIMQDIMTEFCNWSRQRVNTSKSSVLFSPNTPKELRILLGRQFDMPTTYDIGMYLGMPLLQARVIAQTFKPII